MEHAEAYTKEFGSIYCLCLLLGVIYNMIITSIFVVTRGEIKEKRAASI